MPLLQLFTELVQNGGVILIETKSGKEGETSINYKFKIGENFHSQGYEFCNAEDYTHYKPFGIFENRTYSMWILSKDMALETACLISSI